MQIETVRICTNTKRPCTHTEPCKNAPQTLVTLSPAQPATPAPKETSAQ
jgi:hypothetical protein